jgi:hypothetical protein
MKQKQNQPKETAAMNIMKQPIQVVLKDKVATMQLGGWTFFSIGLLTIAIDLLTGAHTIEGAFDAIGKGALALVLGAWLISIAQWQGRVATLEKENATLRASRV